MVLDQRESSNNLYISDKEISYFARQLILEDFGEKKQKILFKTHITFIGIGGINCPALVYLLAIGIRNITLIDYDTKTDWIEKKIQEMKETLDSKNVPEKNLYCENCAYIEQGSKF